MRRELYIYWKLAAADLPQALQATHELQAALQQRHPGLQARLLQRCEVDGDSAGTPTLMEVYTLPGGVTPVVQQDIQVQAELHLTQLAVQRQLEVFFEPG